MSRYIDVDKLLDDIECIDIIDCTDIDDIFIEVEKTIDEQPTADVAEVVRCRDCKYWDKVKNPKHAGKGICISPNKSIGGYCTRKGATLENDYCSLGARKDGET